MSSTTMWCHACVHPRTRGELLRADWPDGRSAAICRPDAFGPRCIAFATGARISLLDAEAAAEHDRAGAVMVSLRP